MSGVSGENGATSYSASSSGCIAHGAIVVITERLAELPDLALPSSLYKEAARPPAEADVLAYLQALLQKDPAAFLARYGAVLQSQELNHFEALRSADFEVDHWLGFYAAQRMEAADQAAHPGRLPARVKNRRLAAMRRLAAQGEYFSDDAMRHRAPLLYHQQIGRFADQEQEHDEEQEEEEEEEGQQRGEEQKQGPVRASHAAAAPPSGPGISGAVGGNCLALALRKTLGACDEPPSGGVATAAATGAAVSGSGFRVAGSEESAGCAAPGSMKGGLPDAVAGSGQVASDAGASGGAGAHGAQAWAKVRGAPEFCSRGRDGNVDAGAGPASWAANRPKSFAGASVLFSEFLMRQDDEAQLAMRRLQQQQEEDAQMSEHDSDDDDDDDDDEDEDNGGIKATRRAGDGARPSTSERALMRRDFLSEMQSRFLLGQDGEYVDYGVIDADTSLDGDWLEEEARDAEEKYFDED